MILLFRSYRMRLRWPTMTRGFGTAPNRWRRCVGLIAVALVIATPATGPAEAQTDKTIGLVVGFAPGGTSSIVAHYLAEGLQVTLNRSVVVENKAGAGGLVAADFVKKQPPDGTSLLVLSSTSLMKFPPTPELTPIGQIATFEYVFVVASKVGAKTLSQYFDQARADPLLRTYASPGAGTLSHLIAESLAQQTEVPLVAVHFRGSAPAATNVLGGHVAAAVLPMPDYVPLRDSIRAIAVGAEARSPLLPEVPTTWESKYAAVTSGWMGLFAPQHTAPDIIQMLSAAAKAALGTNPQFLVDRGFQPTGTTPEEMARIHQRDYDQWLPVLQKLGIAP
jgi:tripartite-type tricarboxylate transporter receptor subunit TctC